jgi:pilus assembly protein CpaF
MDLSDRIARSTGQAPQEAADPLAEVRERLHLALIESLGPQLLNTDTPPAALRELVRSEIRAALAEERGLALVERDGLVDDLTDALLGNGPIERLLADDSITEIMINGAKDVYVERRGQISKTAVTFADDRHLRLVINRMVNAVGRRVDDSSPMVDARLPDGSRVNAVLPPVSLGGPLVTIRKFGTERLTMDDLIRIGTISKDAADFMHQCLRARMNVLISGGTGAGKTTLLNALSASIPECERIVTIEDAAELRLNQQHVLRLESRPSNIEGEGEIKIRDLVRNALRMRPDRIIVGEVRGAEALDMLQSMNTGHDGSLSTVHANSTRDALSRLETMVLMAGFDLPLRAIRQQIASALELVLQLERGSDGVRRVVCVTEVLRMEGDVVTQQDLFAMHPDSGRLLPTGIRATFADKWARNLGNPDLRLAVRA